MLGITTDMELSTVGLQDYFRQNGIPIPEYSLDTEGFMVDKVTGKRLCPL